MGAEGAEDADLLWAKPPHLPSTPRGADLIAEGDNVILHSGERMSLVHIKRDGCVCHPESTRTSIVWHYRR
jgi:hypothetical protein